MNYDMIIFDMDGTLWDTSEVTFEASNIIASMYDEVNEITMETIKSLMGVGVEDEIRITMPDLPMDKANYYIKLKIEKIIDLIRQKGANIYDGVIDTIKELSKYYKLGIVTNNMDSYAKIFIDKSNLQDYFIDYIGAASYGITKDIALKKIVDRNNVKNACYVGDIKNDMISANKAGIDFIHAKYGFGKDLDYEYNINNMYELPELLKKMVK